ncbi:MAG: YlxR family protein [Clostridia bacterium]|nr:YlxR family protein [Clostridia bacterium]
MKNNVQKVKKIPERQCLGCNEHKPKPELIRIVRCPDGEIVLDARGKVSGRGAYICPQKTCFARARKSHRIENMLNCSIPDDIYDAMEARIGELSEGKND